MKKKNRNIVFWRIFPIIIIFIFNVNKSIAAFEKKFFGSHYIGSGYTGIAANRPRFPTLNNSAMLNDIDESGVHLHGQDFYGLKSLYLTALDVHIKIWKIPCGIGMIQFGNDNYKEMTLLTGFGQKFGDLKIGVNISFHSLQIRNYGETNAVGFSLGCGYVVHNMVRLGFLFDKINEPQLGSSGERIPHSFISGIEVSPEKRIKFRIDIIKSAMEPFEYHFGIDYNLSKEMMICFGYLEKINSITCGMVLSYFRLELGYAMSYHMVLGVSNTISFGYEF